MNFADFQKHFNRAYNQFYLSRRIDAELNSKISEFDFIIPEFGKLTLNKQYQRYITVEEGKIRFDEVPIRPYGEIASLLISMITHQVEGLTMWMGWKEHWTMVYSSLTVLMVIDCKLNNRSVKRPDASFHLHRNSMPQPAPGWLKFMPNSALYPNIVVEAEVNDENLTHKKI